MVAVILLSERIGAEWLGYAIPLLTFAVALGSVVALYRRFAGREKSE